MQKLHQVNFGKEIAELEEACGQKVSTCYQCGNCTAGCPASFVYDLQPHQILRHLQLGNLDRVLESKSIAMCLSCSTCSQRCPNNIDIAAFMEHLRHKARHKGTFAVPKVNAFWQSFLDTVRFCGRTYEMGVMALYMMRSGRLWTDVDLAPTALKKNKLPFKPHAITGAEAVGRILKRYEQRCREEGKKA